MNKQMLNGFALGNITGLLAGFVLFTLFPADLFRVVPDGSEGEPLPQMILMDIQRQLNETREELKLREEIIEELKEIVREGSTAETVHFVIEGEDRGPEYAERLREQRAARVHRMVAEMTGAMSLSRAAQSRLREILTEELERPGRHPYAPISFAKGERPREKLLPVLAPGQVEALDNWVEAERARAGAEQVRAWLLQLESIVELDAERREAARVAFTELAASDVEGGTEAVFPVEEALEALRGVLSEKERERLRALVVRR